MRVQKKSPKKLLVLIFSTVSILVIGAGVFYTISSRNNTDNTMPETKSQTRGDSNDSVDEQISGKDQPVREEQKDPLQSYEGDDVNQRDYITGVINYKSIVGQNLVLRTTINQAIGTGTCSLTLTHQSTSTLVARTANVAPNPSSASCEGFDIPTSELTSGTWNIEITVTSGDKTGILRDSVTI